MGNSFKLCLDHKPLIALFGENKGIPTMATERLQRWALLILSGFDYTFEYIKGVNNGAADCLSRFPVKGRVKEVIEGNTLNYDYLHFV